MQVFVQELPEVTLLYLCPKRKMRSLLVAFPAFWRVPGVLRSFNVRADVRHREALVLFAGARRTFPEILLALVQRKFFSTINTHIFARADFLSRGVRLLFGQAIHQNSHARQRYIWVVLPPFFPDLPVT